tara:strand:- start:2053 stop:2724 length:672 start_codon:yes stop_codon:yes gene_type:complete
MDMENVYVFSSPESYDEYEIISKKWNFNLINSKNSILDTRNHIINYFPENTKIIEMDDDVEDIEVTIKGEKNTSVNNLIDLFNESFDLIGEAGLWGFNANTNNYFSAGIDKRGLYSIINSCLGYINDKRIKLTVSEKEDFERCIQFYQLEIPILKRAGYGIKTKYWTNKGGIQAKYDFDRRKEVQAESADAIMEKYPGMCYKRKRPNGIIDIRFLRDPLKFYK